MCGNDSTHNPKLGILVMATAAALLGNQIVLVHNHLKHRRTLDRLTTLSSRCERLEAQLEWIATRDSLIGAKPSLWEPLRRARAGVPTDSQPRSKYLLTALVSASDCEGCIVDLIARLAGLRHSVQPRSLEVVIATDGAGRCILGPFLRSRAIQVIALDHLPGVEISGGRVRLPTPALLLLDGESGRVLSGRFPGVGPGGLSNFLRQVRLISEGPRR